jgi:photosystem II stability/assembly factor-like uncharacterized protein
MKKVFLLLLYTLFCYSTGLGQWVKQGNYTAHRLESVFFPGSNTGYIVGNNGVILKTTDGTNWTQPAGSSYFYMWFYSTFFTDANTGYAVGSPSNGYTGKIYKTIDGGGVWTAEPSGPMYTPNSIFFTGINTGYVVGDELPELSGLVLKTVDGGLNWDSQSTGTGHSSLYEVFFPTSDIGYVVGYHGLILKTTNAGLTWESQVSGTTENLYSVFFSDANTGYAVGHHGTILRTINGGASWTNHSLSFNYTFSSVYFNDPFTGYIVGDTVPTLTGIILYTHNAGATWTRQYVGPSLLTSIFFTDDNTGYAVGDNGIILKTTNGGGTTGIPLDPKAIDLLVFPNPAKEKITIQLSESGRKIEELRIIGNNGHEVHRQQPNCQIIDINVSSLTNGLYFITILNNGNSYACKFIKKE